ncbi:MAG: hypothetical protein LBM72_01315, partial [Mycoplasmataceae bacterium]|nr:hypothetical protein [Mycoplasmataceae bacterium]
TNEIIKLIITYPEILSRPIIIQYVNDKPYRLLIGYNNHDIEIFLRKDTKRVTIKEMNCPLKDQCNAPCSKEPNV